MSPSIIWFPMEAISKDIMEGVDRIYCKNSDERGAVAALAAAWNLRKGGIEMSKDENGWYVRYNLEK